MSRTISSLSPRDGNEAVLPREARLLLVIRQPLRLEGAEPEEAAAAAVLARPGHGGVVLCSLRRFRFGRRRSPVGVGPEMDARKSTWNGKFIIPIYKSFPKTFRNYMRTNGG